MGRHFKRASRRRPLGAALGALVLLTLLLRGTSDAVMPQGVIVSDVPDALYVLAPGETWQLSAKVTPPIATGVVTWSTSDDTVASVSADGVVTTGEKGQTQVQASCGDVSSSEVTLTAGTPVSEVTLSEVAMLNVDEEVTVASATGPEDATNTSLSWTSSDASVAIVTEAGVVKAMGAGTATITAAARDGHGAAGSVEVTVFDLNSASCNFIAHRGLCTEAPENTLAAFRAAGEAGGFYGAECDVYETQPEDQDDPTTSRFVICHNESLAGLWNTDALVTELTPSEVRMLTPTGGTNYEQYSTERVPFLEEYLEVLASYGMTPVIELKDDEMSDESIGRLIDAVASVMSVDDVQFISFYSDLLDRVKEQCDERDLHPTLGYLVSARWGWFEKEDLTSAEEGVQRAADYGFDYVSPDEELLSEDVMALADELGLGVGTWTIDDRITAWELLQAYPGIDYITTDYKLFR